MFAVLSKVFRARWVAPLAMFVSLSAQAAQIDLLQPGEGEMATVRLHPKAGTSESMQITLDMDMKMDMGGMGQMPTDLPPLVMTLDATVDKVEPNGDIHYTYTLKDMKIAEGGEVEPMLRAALEKQLPTLEGAKGTHVVSATGVVKKSDFKPPAGAAEQQLTNMQKGMNHASAAFPDEPIGIGARWRVTQPVHDNGLSLEQTVVYTLKERSGDKVVLTTELIQKPAADAKIEVQGANAELARFQSMGDGETTIDLGRLFPTSGNLNHYLNSLMRVSQQAGDMSVGLEMDMKLEMQRL